jgi:hypothetical protein
MVFQPEAVQLEHGPVLLSTFTRTDLFAQDVEKLGEKF